MTSVLKGRRILVVEDEPLIAMMLVEILEGEGCEVAGPAYNEAQAFELLKTEQINVAILDFNLGRDQTSAGIATHLVERDIPFLFATGYGVQALRNANWTQPAIGKPYHAPEVIAAVTRLLDTPLDAKSVA